MSSDFDIRLIQSFDIKEEYMTDLPVTYSWTSESGKPCSILSHASHPAFEALRIRLERDGFIKVERGWHNGDRVIRSFKLNGVMLYPGDRFSCPYPLKVDLQRKREKQNAK